MLDEIPYLTLPQGWVAMAVGGLCQIVGGGTPSTSNEEYWQGNIPWITSADIYGLKDVRPRRHINERAVQESATNLLPSGSIIVVTRVGLGKVAFVREDLCFSQDSQGLVFDGRNLHGMYLSYFLSEAVKSFKYEGRGTTIRGVTKKKLHELPVLVPPLASNTASSPRSRRSSRGWTHRWRHCGGRRPT
jgi:type I restriction enzyme S subunit